MEANRVILAYKECQRNFAATLGMNTTDGCGEYTSNTLNLESLLCNACGCHRSFHRKVEVETVQDVVLNLQPLNQNGGGGNNGVSEEIMRNSEIIGSDSSPSTSRRKPKDYSIPEIKKMWEFAENLEWKMPGKNKELQNNLLEFCAGMNITKMQFKSWMHTHKKTMAGPR